METININDNKKSIYKNKFYAFKQQQLKAWQPILTPFPVIISFLIIAIIFIIIGIILLIASNSVIEFSTRYDNLPNCPLNSSCIINFTISTTMKRPIYMYYGLENYYQNHRRYVQSKSDTQLAGEVIYSYSSLSTCSPRISLNNSQNPNYFYEPCGLIPWSMFNDSFMLYSGNNLIPLRKQGIAWSSDLRKFNNPPNGTKGIRIIENFKDEDFIVWMRVAGLPNFKKLYRIIDQDIPAGIYQIKIFNNYPVSSFNGKKYICLSTTSWIGGKNPFLGWAYITVGLICLIEGIFFAIKQKISPRKLGDLKYLDWNK
jgi:uncharacterized membrane protein